MAENVTVTISTGSFAARGRKKRKGILTTDTLRHREGREVFTTEYAEYTDKAGNPNAKARKKSE